MGTVLGVATLIVRRRLSLCDAHGPMRACCQRYRNGVIGRSQVTPTHHVLSCSQVVRCARSLLILTGRKLVSSKDHTSMLVSLQSSVLSFTNFRRADIMIDNNYYKRWCACEKRAPFSRWYAFYTRITRQTQLLQFLCR